MTTLKIRARAIVAIVLTLVLAGAIPAPALAAPSDAKRAQAVRVKAQVDALDTKMEMATEDYDQANTSYQNATAKVSAAENRLKVLTARQRALQGKLGVRVKSMYRSGPLGPIELLLGATTWDEFTTTWDLLRSMNESDAESVSQLKQTRSEVTATRESLLHNQRQAAQQLKVMASRKSSIEKQLAERKKMLTGIEAEVAALQAAEDRASARAAARARAAAASYTSRGSSTRSSGSGGDYGSPTNSPHSGVVAIAESKLGSPYQWGAAGPSSFDCSGFTMWVYAHVGVSLPHSSRAQIGYGQRVSRANLRPGDLVFFGTSVIHHVGIYIGGGMFIHAPHTGDVVKISPLDRSDYAGACRP